jgi:hypothetical protein
VKVFLPLLQLLDEIIDRHGFFRFVVSVNFTDVFDFLIWIHFERSRRGADLRC